MKQQYFQSSGNDGGNGKCNELFCGAATPADYVKTR